MSKNGVLLLLLNCTWWNTNYLPPPERETRGNRCWPKVNIRWKWANERSRCFRSVNSPLKAVPPPMPTTKKKKEDEDDLLSLSVAFNALRSKRGRPPFTPHDFTPLRIGELYDTTPLNFDVGYMSVGQSRLTLRHSHLCSRCK